ncbi:hypothetical protein GYMLUDRAFT_215607 [Collybiopsis luxurians FD-317 M1]|nr:hypothetical protein GYMLUDRAFT_215607 [Collybiopsis luxurians FD-317 M1]
MSTSVFVVPIDPKTVSDADIAKVWDTVPRAEKGPDVGTARIFYNTPPGKITAASTLGDNFSSKKGDARREAIRKSVGGAVKALKALDGLKEVNVDASADPHAAAVAAYLASYNFTLKTTPPSLFNPNLREPIPPKFEIKALENSKEWHRGVTYAYSQNLARTLMELPANMMTPTVFCERVRGEFAGIENVEVIIRDEDWAASKGMNAFLSVTHGTNEPAKFLEIHYMGAPQKDARPVAFVGKGITFDSGGISLKPAADMKAMRGDMGGAASVVSATIAIAKLKLPVNLVTVTPLAENLPGPSATKPGDIIYAMNGKSVEVDNTDMEGRLVLSDAIYYASTEYKPHTLIDVATLTYAMVTALGEVYTGVFSSSDTLWQRLHAAGEHEFDRFWRMPLSEDYGPQIYSSNADLCNNGGQPAGSATAALFLKSFADGIEAEDGSNSETAMKWAHLDIAGAGFATRPTPYQEKGMTGRPVRALIEYVRGLSN